MKEKSNEEFRDWRSEGGRKKGKERREMRKDRRVITKRRQRRKN